MKFREPGKSGSDVRLRGSPRLTRLKTATQEMGVVYYGRYEGGDGNGDGGARLEVLHRRNCPASLYARQTMERSRM